MNRALRRFAIATWAASAGLVAIFALFWRIAYAPPHALWAIVTTSSVVVAGGLTIVVGLWRFITGPQRVLTVAIVLLGTTPIVWFAMFLLALYLQITVREPLNLDAPTRIAGFFTESVGDIEARWRYPRWTHGQHLILLDDNEMPEPEKLVAQMDKHIEQMAARLHTPVPTVKARWVRGSLLGLHGHAVISWAICDADQHVTELTSLDRHEMAHVIITALGSVDQDPPMLLCEGWAESQSKDRNEMILQLNQKAEFGPIYRLQELVEPNWYGRSDGPAYDHGGPLCIYLMEHYGVEKFRALYHGVRHTTFMADSERILGDSWKVVEDNFWKWLSSEAAKINAERGIKPPVLEPEKEITFATSVAPRDWQTIVDGYRNTWPKRPPLPKAFAYITQREWTGPIKAPGDDQKKRSLVSKYVVDGDLLWHIRDLGPDRYTIGEVFTPTLDAFVAVLKNGRVDSYRPATKQAVNDAIDDATHWSNSCDLAHYLPVGSNRNYLSNFHIESIRRPAADGTEWEVEYVTRARENGAESKYKLTIDAAADWSVVSEKRTFPEAQSKLRTELGSVWGRTSPTGMTVHTTTTVGASTFQLHFHELTAAEAASVREEAEQIARSRPPSKWYAPLTRPGVVAIAWPGTGVLLLLAGILLAPRTRQGSCDVES